MSSLEIPTSSARQASLNSSSSNSVVISPATNVSPKLFQSNVLTTLEKEIYKQRYFDEEDGHGEDDDEEERSNFLDMNDDEDEDDLEKLMDNLPPSPPSSPPRELIPDRLYALYDFEGPDPNHLKLQRNDPVELLNDEDNYWWLVKNLANFKVGFVPAEFLENYDERLARLNCWKNEQHEKSSKQSLIEQCDENEIIVVNGDKLIDFNRVKAEKTSRGNKIVAFNLKEDDEKRTEVLSEIYSDYTPLLVTKSSPAGSKEDSFLSNQNFLVKSLDDYIQRPPQQIFKEDSIGSFSSDTTITTMNNSPNPNGARPESLDAADSNLNNSIKLLDDYIKEQTTNSNTNTPVMRSTSISSVITTSKDNESLSSESSSNSLTRNNTTTTPLTSESYLNNDSFMKFEQSPKKHIIRENSLIIDPTANYHPFVHELFDDLVREIESLSMLLQRSL